MKLLFSLLSTLIVVHAASLQPLDKWSDVLEKVNQIRNIVLSGLDAAGDAAFRDNQSVGLEIVAKLKGGTDQANLIFEELVAEIAAETLTVEKAEQQLDMLKLTLANNQQQIAELVRLLTQSVQDRIKTILDSTYNQTEILANQVRVLLSS